MHKMSNSVFWVKNNSVCFLLKILSSVLSITVNYQGPVVQSVVSLTSSLRVILLTILADSIYNILIFLAEKM